MLRRTSLILLAGAVIALLGLLNANTHPLALAAQQTEADRAESRAVRRTPVVDVFEASRDAVVNISSTEIVTQRSYSGIDRFFDDMFDMPSRPRTRQYTRQSIGSGFVLHADGYIVTNAHVVRGTTDRKVTFANGEEYEAEIIALDVQRDLAVLKIDADHTLHTLPLGRSDDIMVGETVIAIGNPLGFEHTVTAGVVSAQGRDIQISREHALTNLIQTDASINPGNSGGPLLNVLGELIGINTAIRGDAQNIGFAIPVDQLREILPDLLDVERRQRIVSGVRVGTLQSPVVLDVDDDSPADKAGLRAGDIIRTLNRAPVSEGVDYYIELIGHHAGDKLDMQVERNGRLVDLSYKLTPRPDPDGRRLALEKLGIEVHPLPEDLVADLGLRRNVGLLVVNVEAGSPADNLGLQRRDVVLAIGRRYVTTLEDLGFQLEYLDAGDELDITILRVDRQRGKMKLSGTLVTR
jgi:serine protease Do